MTTPDIAAAPTGANTIVIACKLPAGVKLELGRPDEDGYETHTLKGSNSKTGILDGTGYALTTLPRMFWERWLNQPAKDSNGKIIHKTPNQSLAWIRNKLVYAHQDRDNVEAFALENSKARSGLEPLDQSKLPEGLQKFTTKD